MSVAGDDVVGVAFYRTRQHEVIGGVGCNDLRPKDPRCYLCILDEQPEECLFFLRGEANQGTQFRVGENPVDLREKVGGGEEKEPPVMPGRADPVLKPARPNCHADDLVRIQDGADHRRARAARTASSIAASSFFAGIFLVRALIRSRILNRSFRSC